MSKTRVSVPLSETLYKEIQIKSETMGISMSSYIAFVIANTLQNETMMIRALSGSVGAELKQLLNKPIVTGIENKDEDGE